MLQVQIFPSDHGKYCLRCEFLESKMANSPGYLGYDRVNVSTRRETSIRDVQGKALATVRLLIIIVVRLGPGQSHKFPTLQL